MIDYLLFLKRIKNMTEKKIKSFKDFKLCVFSGGENFGGGLGNLGN